MGMQMGPTWMSVKYFLIGRMTKKRTFSHTVIKVLPLNLLELNHQFTTQHSCRLWMTQRSALWPQNRCFRYHKNTMQHISDGYLKFRLTCIFCSILTHEIYVLEFVLT